MQTNIGNNTRSTRSDLNGAKAKLNKVEIIQFFNCIQQGTEWKDCCRLFNISEGLFYTIMRGDGAYKYLRLNAQYEDVKRIVKETKELKEELNQKVLEQFPEYVLNKMHLGENDE